MKLLILLLLSFSTSVFAECISGDCVNGLGTYTRANGDKYDGAWKNDKKEGQGTYTWTDGVTKTYIYKNGKEVTTD